MDASYFLLMLDARMPKPYTPQPQPFKPSARTASHNRGSFLGILCRSAGAMGKAVLAAVAALVITMLAIGSFAALSGSFAPPPVVLPADAPVAIVLGAGVRDGAPDRRSQARTETAVRLFLEQRAGRLHLTGGSRGATPAAVAMRDYALSRGVPRDAITIETHSQTTVQNALFSAEALRPLPSNTILVTDAAHLPRAWVSFAWAGYRDLSLVPADAEPGETRAQKISFLVREALALWYNAGRMALVGALLLLGADADQAAKLFDRLPVGWRLPT